MSNYLIIPNVRHEKETSLAPENMRGLQIANEEEMIESGLLKSHRATIPRGTRFAAV
jgi:hypothetical protein